MSMKIMIMKYLVAFTTLILAVETCPSHNVAEDIPKEDAIRGYYHAWWSIIPLPIKTIRDMLPGPGFDLADVSIPNFPTDQHPVFMEIGYETDTGPINLKPFWMDFEEFKYDIPYVKALGSTPDADVFPLNFKSVLYMPTLLLAESSRLSYNLNASEADGIKMTDVSYTIQKGSLNFKADFKADGDWEAYGTRFSIMEKIVSQRWFGKWDSNWKSCADHHYDFNTVKFRSAAGTIQADEGIVSPFFPSGAIEVPSLNQIPYGTVEVYANFTITSAFDCLP